MKRKPEENIHFEILDIDDLKLLSEDENPRLHTKRNLDDIGESIEEFGLIRSIGIDEENTVLVGNGTTTASKLKNKKKVIVVDSNGDYLVAVRRKNLSPEQKEKAIIADNRTNETSRWNSDVLIRMMDKFQSTDHTGWHAEEFQHYKETHEFDESEFDHFFQDDESGEDQTGKMNLRLSFTEDDGNKVIEELKKVDKDLSEALLKILKLK